MTPESLRRFALSLPGTHEAPHRERTSFRIGSRIFATMTADGGEAMVRATPAAAQALIAREPDTFFGYGAWTTNGGALGVRLGEVAEPRMRELVADSWRRIAPKKLAAELDGAPPRASPRRRRPS